MREFTKLDEWSTWVPDVDDERKAYSEGDESALSMELRFMTKADRDRYQRLSEKFKKQSGSTSQADKKAAKQLFVDNVRNVQNYTVDGIAVTSGGDLYDVEGDDELIVEVTKALFQRSSLEAGLAKKLRSSSDSLRGQATSREGGAVVGATPASTPRTLVTSQREASLG